MARRCRDAAPGAPRRAERRRGARRRRLPRAHAAATTTSGGGGGGGGTPAESGGKLKTGGTLRVGATGGGAKDTIDAHMPDGRPRHHARLEPLRVAGGPHARLHRARDAARRVDRAGARRRTSGRSGSRTGITFHNGKPVTADDVHLLAPAHHRPEGPEGRRGLDRLRRREGAQEARRPHGAHPAQVRRTSGFPDDIGQYFNAIVPTDYDPQEPGRHRPVQVRELHRPASRACSTKYPDYWETGKPYVDELVIIDFPDDTARVNALLGGQVDAIDEPAGGADREVKSNPDLQGARRPRPARWQPFTMRVDQAPFDDVRVRQAFRLIVDREQMIAAGAAAAQGRIANDLYSPLRPGLRERPAAARAGPRAGQVAAQAGRAGGPARRARHRRRCSRASSRPRRCFAEQAKGAGVDVKVRKVDPGTFYGDNYLKWPFAQDFWATRAYLEPGRAGRPAGLAVQRDALEGPEVRRADRAGPRASSTRPSASDILHEAQTIAVRAGRLHHPVLRTPVDAYSAKLGGFVSRRSAASRSATTGSRTYGFLA